MKIKKIAIIIGLTIIPMILLCNNVFQVVSEKQDELIIEFNLSEYKIIEKNNRRITNEKIFILCDHCGLYD